MLKLCAIVLVLVGSSYAMMPGMMGGMMGGMGPGGMHPACMSSFLRKDPATRFQGRASPFKVNPVQKTYSTGSSITVKIESTNPTDKFTDFACAFDLGMMTPIEDGSISRQTAQMGKNCMVTVAKKPNSNTPVSSATFVWTAPRQFYYEEPLQWRCAVYTDARTVYEIRSADVLTTNPSPNLPTFKKWKFDEAQRKLNDMMSGMQWGQGGMNPMSMMQSMMGGQNGQGANPMAAFKMMGSGGQGGAGGMNMGQMMQNMRQSMQGMQQGNQEFMGF